MLLMNDLVQKRIRVVFRFLFTVPLLTIGLDAFFPPYRVIQNPWVSLFSLLIKQILMIPDHSRFAIGTRTIVYIKYIR